MKKLSQPVAIVAAIVFAAVVTSIMLARASGDIAQRGAVDNPALTVTAIRPQVLALPMHIPATGNIAAWQEASIGTEADGLRLIEVKVNVGDAVKRGQVLAIFASQTVIAELAEARAAAEEAAATLSEAQANARRARTLDATGAMSTEQINRYVTAERAARARLEAAQAIEQQHRLRLAQTQVVAPDDGVISSRSATVSAVLPAGQELFRMILKGRLEWRAEVAAADLVKLSPGQIAHVGTGNQAVEGRLRVIAPTIDTQTRSGLVYVDLPVVGATGAGQMRAGMFVRGHFEIGQETALTLPQSAVLLRDGFSYVLRIGADQKVVQTKVTAGRRAGDLVEITSGLAPAERVVESGGSFLGDGDLVRVVEPSGPDGGKQVPALSRTAGVAR